MENWGNKYRDGRGSMIKGKPNRRGDMKKGKSRHTGTNRRREGEKM